MPMRHEPHHRLKEHEERLLGELRHARRSQRDHGAAAARPPRLTSGQRFADSVTGTVGSWRFILVQSGMLALWIAANVVGWIGHCNRIRSSY